VVAWAGVTAKVPLAWVSLWSTLPPAAISIPPGALLTCQLRVLLLPGSTAVGWAVKLVMEAPAGAFTVTVTVRVALMLFPSWAVRV
jgi:hypothetical protein